MSVPQNQKEAAQQVKAAQHALNAAMEYAAAFDLKIEISNLTSHTMGARFERPILMVNCFAEIT